MNILITGGAGFIGSRVTRKICQFIPSAKIFILDNLHEQVHGKHAQFPNFPANVSCHKLDIQDRGSVEETVKSFKPTHVIHLAAETGTSQSMDEIQRYCAVNVQGTAILIEALLRSAPQLQQFILASSRAVYGEGRWLGKDNKTYYPPPRTEENIQKNIFTPVISTDIVLTQPMAAVEADLPLPSSIYASTKLMQEHLALQSKLHSKSLIFRFQNVYGAGQSLKNPYTGVLSIFTQQLLNGKKIEIYEDGNIVRDFVHVDDIVDGIYLALQKNIMNGEIINLGSGEETTILFIAKLITSTLQFADDRLVISGKFRPGDIRYARANISKAKSLLNWTPQVSLSEGIQKLVEWSKLELNYSK